MKRICAAIILLATGCQQSETDLTGPALFAWLFGAESNRRYEAIQAAFAAWQLPIAPELGRLEYTERPAYWISFSDSQCSYEGKEVSGCPLNNEQIVGFCSPSTSGDDIERFDLVSRPAEDTDLLVRILTHELGHCLGLNHSNDTTDIMYFTTQFPVLEPDTDELERLQRLYSGTYTGADLPFVLTDGGQPILADLSRPFVISPDLMVAGSYQAGEVDLQ